MLGERLAYLRRREGISQKELGSKLNLSHYTISSYEKDRSEPNDEIKARIARYFNVSSDFLMGLIDQPLPYDREEGVLYLPRNMSPSAQRLFREFVAKWQ
ncbi:MAG: helix-turn-helix transcriptional regulator [Angelakisella sp.]|nr:helix-turn-helix transcriptional regulator [Angelakisella sp.]